MKFSYLLHQDNRILTTDSISVVCLSSSSLKPLTHSTHPSHTLTDIPLTLLSHPSALTDPNRTLPHKPLFLLTLPPSQITHPPHTPSHTYPDPLRSTGGVAALVR